MTHEAAEKHDQVNIFCERLLDIFVAF